jgi:hypothetical protein
LASQYDTFAKLGKSPRNHKLQEPLQTDAYCTADPAQRDSLQQESFNQRALLLGNHRMFWIEDKGPTTHFAAVVLFPRMDMPISLEPCGSTLGTGFSWHHDTLLGLLYFSVSVPGLE